MMVISKWVTNCFLMIFLTGSFLRSDAQNPFNVVIVVVDDLGWNDLGYAGSTLYQTPNIDLLSQEGIVFTQAYSSHPVCSPSRAAMMTGKNPTRLGITDWIPGSDPQNRLLLGPEIRHELPLEETTIAEYFKKAGYRTFFAGKWHLGGEGYLPEDQGFEVNIGGVEKGSPPGGYYAPYNNPKLSDGPDGEYLTDRLTDETINFIDQHKDEPFFVLLSYYTVHTPIQASKEDRSIYDDISVPERTFPEGEGRSLLYQNNMDYASMVTAMDRNIGHLIQYLKNSNQWENTVFLFTSDNGGLSTLAVDWKIPTSTMPLRGGKGWCFEGGIRIPQVLHLPDKGPSTISSPVIHHDILPTVWTAAGMNPEQLQAMDGVNMMDSNLVDLRTLFWHYPHYHGSGWVPGSAIREGEWKLIYFYETMHAELYNLSYDPQETMNLTAKYPEKTHHLKEQLLQLIRQSNGRFPRENTNFAEPDK